ncbi:MAG: class I SAM-dependent methyltransferase [Parvularculaceae bacterium]|nr:class I SAM-dependent methyltransferase [Parvularculaceae bacterium]
MPLVFRYAEWRRSAAAERPPAVDESGVPIPPPHLIMLVLGHTDWRAFLGGEAALRVYADAAARNGVDFAAARRVLDLGCGCGRLARHLPKATSAEIYGADYNPQLARWCARNLHGTFTVNQNLPPLDYADGFFDVIYLNSVFTHQRLQTQNAWLAEFCRVLRPGGLALVTFHDEDHASVPKVGLSRADVVARGLIVHNDRAEGSNFMATYQSRAFARAQFGAVLDVAEITPSNETGLSQALAVLRRPA